MVREEVRTLQMAYNEEEKNGAWSINVGIEEAGDDERDFVLENA